MAKAKPRVLFVSRERHRLPLDSVQRRKWDAVAGLLDYRVLAAAQAGSPSREERFRLAGPARPGLLDGLLYYLRLPWRIGRELRGFAPDAAVVQGIHEMAAFLLARRLTGARTRAILDVQGDWRYATRLYGSPARRLLSPLDDLLGPFVVRRCDGVRAISSETASLVRALGVEPLGVLAPFVDVDAFLAVPSGPLPDAPTALFVGVLEQIKGFDTLVAAWPEVVRQVPEARLRIVGRGTLAPLARRLARSAADRVQWDEWLPAAGVASAIDDSWLLALPSRSEGLGRVLLEAACRGRALVGTRRGGIVDVVSDGENGLLVDPADPDALAAAIVRVLSDRAEAMRLGSSARSTAERFGLGADRYAERLAAIVAAVLA